MARIRLNARRPRGILAVLGAVAVSAAVTVPIVVGFSGAPRRPRVATRAATSGSTLPAIGLCGIANPSGSGPGAFETPTSYTAPPTAVSPTTIYPSNQVSGFYFDSADGDVYTKTTTSIVVSSASGTVLDTFAIPTATTSGAAMREGNASSAVVVDPSGNIYFYMMVGYTFDLVQLGATGTQQWDLPVPGTPIGLFAWHDAMDSWAAAIVGGLGGGAATSSLVAPSGAPANGSEPVLGANSFGATSVAGGGLVYSEAGYVHELDATGSAVAPSSAGVPVFGDGSGASVSQVPGAPLGFGVGGVAEAASTIYVVNSDASIYGEGIDLFTPTGVFEGDASSGSLGNLASASPLYYDPTNQTLIYLNSSGIVSITLSGVQALVSTAASPTENGFGDALGVGAGLTTTATANYFAPGTTPAVTASFDPWWRSYPDPLELSYWVANGAQVTSNDLPTPTVAPLSWSGVSSGSPLQMPVLAPAVPGVYLVNADLIDTTTGVTIGATCLTYSVGMAGDTLDFSSLAPGLDSGGPAPERGVQLAEALGTGDMREQLNLASLLPSCNPSTPTAATCGPAALTNWTSVDPATGQAATEAKALGVNFEVQFAAGSSVDVALTYSGYWQPDVTAIVEHFHTSAPDLVDVEAWNEPNGSSGFNPSNYVYWVLKPFYEAVQAANAVDGTDVQVIGGTVLGPGSAGWWTGLAQAGGFSYMNIAGIHPYPGYDRSFEEEGTPAALVQLKSLMASSGVASMPIWITEQGWWSYGEGTFYDIGNWAPREWMWLRSLGITSWNYFITEGEYQAFGLIDAASGDYSVNPGAIGLMTVSNLLGDRPFLEQVSLGIPHAYGMLFGPPASGRATNDVLAVWTDDLDVAGAVSLTSGSGTVTIGTTGALGAPGSVTVSPSSPAPLALSGAPTYLSVPAGDTISVGPAETFGSNLALASTGASATASSSQGSENAAGDVIQGNANAENAGGLGSTSAWASVQGDPSPWIQVTLGQPSTVDRVVVSTSSLGSVLPGLRNYSVELDQGGTWTTVASVTNEFFDRMEQLSFPAATGVSAIKVLPTAFDFNDNVGGLPPSYWSPTGPDYAVIYSVEAYAPGTATLPIPTTLPTIPTTLPTIPTTLPTIPTTLPTKQPVPRTAPSSAPAPQGTSSATASPVTALPQAASPSVPAGTSASEPAVAPAAGASGAAPTSPKGRDPLTKLAILSPRVLRSRTTLVVHVKLAGRHGVPTGAVMVELGGHVLCRSSLRRGLATCQIKGSMRVSPGRRHYVLMGRTIRYALAIVYRGSRTYAGFARKIFVRVTPR